MEQGAFFNPLTIKYLCFKQHLGVKILGHRLYENLHVLINNTGGAVTILLIIECNNGDTICYCNSEKLTVKLGKMMPKLKLRYAPIHLLTNKNNPVIKVYFRTIRGEKIEISARISYKLTNKRAGFHKNILGNMAKSILCSDRAGFLPPKVVVSIVGLQYQVASETSLFHRLGLSSTYEEDVRLGIIYNSSQSLTISNTIHSGEQGDYLSYQNGTKEKRYSITNGADNQVIIAGETTQYSCTLSDKGYNLHTIAPVCDCDMPTIHFNPPMPLYITGKEELEEYQMTIKYHNHEASGKVMTSCKDNAMEYVYMSNELGWTAEKPVKTLMTLQENRLSIATVVK